MKYAVHIMSEGQVLATYELSTEPTGVEMDQLLKRHNYDHGASGTYASKSHILAPPINWRKPLKRLLPDKV